ncbi:hypothetical protein CFK39_10735 [Brachybacterium avium]|uniref:Uncharacterized protein n=1 Tax=Brachybacterium avium TaxID=2017485 RepID=A0A220UET9_9MICO|nr:hypothetical protein [Brachybacterium avium]ASK66213.1 hypothetical protein CFK39_10735 [Brachybacterium avium]
MTPRPIMDAGPGLNFFALTKERMLFATVGQRVRATKDLGEMMVVAHAVVAAEAGDEMTVLIDDGGGRRLAALEAQRLDRLRGAGRPVGQMRLISTMTVLRNAAGKRELPDRQSMRDLYTRMRRLDDGLVPLDQTDLMTLPCWSVPREVR